MRIYSKNMHSCQIHPNPTWNDGAFQLLMKRCPMQQEQEEEQEQQQDE